MDGNASKLFSRSSAGRAAAVALTIGVVSVGLSACGSGSSSSTAPVVKKEAGLLTNDVVLTVTNALPHMPADYENGDWFWVCFSGPGGCATGVGNEHEPAPGESVSATGTKVLGQLQYPIGYTYFAFTATDPDIGRPSIELRNYTTVISGCRNHGEDGSCQIDGKSWTLSDGESKDVSMHGDTFTLARSDSGGNVRMTLTAHGGATLP